MSISPNDYFLKIARLLNNGLIGAPKNFEDGTNKPEISWNDDQIISWEFDNWKVELMENSVTSEKSGVLTITEDGYSNHGVICFEHFAYHFEPKEKGLFSYRIDRNSENHVFPGVHYHIYIDDMQTHHYPSETEIDIENYNCCEAISLGLKYVCSKNYPFDL